MGPPRTLILAPAVLFLYKAQVSVLVSQRLPFRVSHVIVPLVFTPKTQKTEATHPTAPSPLLICLFTLCEGLYNSPLKPARALPASFGRTSLHPP